MESLAYTSYDSALPLSSFTTQGDLIFRQRTPLEIREKTSFLYDKEELTDEAAASFRLDESDLSIVVLERYAQRDFATDYHPRFVSSKKALFDSKRHISSQKQQHFNFTMVIDIPTQEITYIPTFSDIMKDAWIKYVSIFVLVCLLLRQLCSVVYYHQM